MRDESRLKIEQINALATHTPPAPELLDMLSDRDIQVRHAAVDALTTMGDSAIPALIQALNAQNGVTRLEAARALRDLSDPATAQAFLHAMRDPRDDVRWVATHALAELGRDGAVAVLQALAQSHWDDFELRRNAHYILRELAPSGEYGQHIIPVLHALDRLHPELEVPSTAYQALTAMGAPTTP